MGVTVVRGSPLVIGVAAMVGYLGSKLVLFAIWMAYAGRWAIALAALAFALGGGAAAVTCVRRDGTGVPRGGALPGLAIGIAATVVPVAIALIPTLWAAR